MNHHPFLGGVGLGMLAGAALSMAIAPKKKDLKRTARKAIALWAIWRRISPTPWASEHARHRRDRSVSGRSRLRLSKNLSWMQERSCFLQNQKPSAKFRRPQAAKSNQNQKNPRTCASDFSLLRLWSVRTE